MNNKKIFVKNIDRPLRVTKIPKGLFCFAKNCAQKVRRNAKNACKNAIYSQKNNKKPFYNLL